MILPSAIVVGTNVMGIYSKLFSGDYIQKTKTDQLKMVYLFMSIEDKINQENMDQINLLAKDMILSADNVKSAIDACEGILGKAFDKDDRFDLILKNIYDFGKGKIEAEKRQTLWMLVNCAFKDGEYSSNERRMLRNLTRDWEIEDNVTVLTEMEDTAEALLALEKHKEWIKTTNYSYEHIHSVVEELDKNKQELAENISLLASIG